MLALRSKPPGGFEPRLESGKFFVQCAKTRQARGLDIELKFAPRLVNRGHRAQLDAQPIFEREIEQLCLMPEEYATDLCQLVLEKEIAMTGGGASEIGHLTADPGEPKMPLDEQPGRAHEERDGQHRR